MNLNEFFNHLASDNSRLFKVAELKKHQGNGLLKQVIFLALDTFTQFYIRKIPKYVPESSGIPIKLDAALNSLSALSNRTFTGHAGIAHLKMILESLSADDAKVIERIIEKDLDCGVAASTVNEVWPGLIFEYPVMLCTPNDEKVAKKFKMPGYGQLKADGMRSNAIVKDGVVQFFSRNGKAINLLGNLEKEFLEFAAPCEPHMFDGEMVIVRDGKILPRKIGNGILNKAVKGTITPEEAAEAVFIVWDCVPYREFLKGIDNTPYHLRFEYLQDLKTNSNSDKIRVIESHVVNTFEEANQLFQDYVDKGEEGIILKEKHGNWQDKRVKHQIKFKSELECELRIVGILPGSGKNEGMVGSFLGATEDGLIEARFGSGITDELRPTLGEHNIGQIVTVKYNARIKSSGDKKESLFLPIFIEFRHDKDKADYAKDVK